MRCLEGDEQDLKRWKINLIISTGLWKEIYAFGKRLLRLIKIVLKKYWEMKSDPLAIWMHP